MPSFHRWAAQGQQSRLPPTPPEYQNPYLTPISAVSDDMSSYYSSQSYPRHGRSSREYSERYPQIPGYSSQQSVSSHGQGRVKQMHGSQDYHMNYPQPMPTQYHYGPIAAPILPPLRATEDTAHFTSQYGHAHPEPKQKEEKPIGGVAQHLDYEMDLMSRFVAEVSQRIVSQGNSPPTPQYRKYVSQILSSTRLPSSTIMLGLFYLQERMKIESQRGRDTKSSGTVYRMLTTCLLLGSKFLDDNTFQNRSWAEVSSIPVQELNSMEVEWLKDFNWEIHGIMYDKDEGFYMWIEHWHAYEEKAEIDRAKEMQKLAPINTSLTRHQHTHLPMMSPDGPIPPQYQQGPQYDTQWVRPLMSEYSPPSAPHSGPPTPDYYGNNWGYSQVPQSFSRSSWNACLPPTYSSQRAQASAYSGNYYGQGFQHSNTWTGHGSNCGCGSCSKHAEYYFNQPGYSLQSVVG